ncbi:MAG: AMP-dependent synthetase [Anaerolineae bacterium]|nr:MAG: AMP-dependent synthetase [Anaerolineae bacterium]
MNAADYFLRNARDDAPAFVTAEGQVTYAQFRAMCIHLVAELTARGICSGERVAILAKNSPFWAAAYLAVLKLGAVAVPISNLYPPDEVRRVLDFAECKFLFFDKPALVKYASISGGLPYFLLDNNLLQADSAPWTESAPGFDPESDAALMPTSGTTARPRLVRITHRNLQANTNSIIEYLELTATERMMVVLPFYYCYGASLLHTHLRVGATLVISNTFTYPETVLDMMESAQCTGFAGVPSTYQILLRNSTFPRRQLPHLKKLQQAGGKLHNALLQELAASHPEARVYVMYGQTEATARLSYLPPELLQRKLGSIGRGIPGVSLKVLDENGNPIRPGETGEIVAQGQNISPGYLEDEEANREKFRNGLLYTGDLATVDEDGFIYIVDRKSDFIKSYGHRISSYEIESCILQIPQVVSVAVVGLPDEQAGEQIAAFVVRQTGAALNEQDVLQHCRVHLARHMLPQSVIFLPALPLNAHGKVLKSELRKMKAAA